MGSRPAATARISSSRPVDGGKGHYVGACGCTYHVQDDARVLYFDDPVMDDVEARTSPRCDTLRRCLCRGQGQAVRVQSRICCGGCVRTRGLHGLPCLPTCCVFLCEPAVLRYDMPAKVSAKRVRTCVVPFCRGCQGHVHARSRRTWITRERAMTAEQPACLVE